MNKTSIELTKHLRGPLLSGLAVGAFALTSTVASGQVVANFIDDFQTPNPAADWRYQFTSAANLNSPAFAQAVNDDGIQLWDTRTSSGAPLGNGMEIEFVAVPEPATYALIGGLLALGFVMVRRCRRREGSSWATLAHRRRVKLTEVNSQ